MHVSFKFEANSVILGCLKKGVNCETRKLILRKSMVKFDIEWKLTEYPMWHKITWIINMCDKLFFSSFFHLKLRQHIVQGLNELEVCYLIVYHPSDTGGVGQTKLPKFWYVSSNVQTVTSRLRVRWCTNWASSFHIVYLLLLLTYMLFQVSVVSTCEVCGQLVVSEDSTTEW